ncbi:type III secretion system inner membrane ring subunit SctD [Bordetella genomosp. 9]|uniref:EscD/YscD/HrpQ family type III secretion system inner membrane ring protein n=1 Tax=Bordetella genomosp. 9 TaxID=1416803 RepID=A0A1W6YX19_9BORD|nr:type III secretion system inner membrane ring subunit SctD [Bordetella genomosp. 9]ARP85645.1 EscD/YscD/HrpQ family type III secretion system inner membrane ring protein [Bordetella genomosp. 9]
MKVSGEFEFRVLTGLHERARCVVSDTVVIGSDVACDVVLLDGGIAPRHAVIRVDTAGWSIALQDETSGTDIAPKVWRLNTPVRLGPLWVTVSAAGDAWPELSVAPESPAGTEASHRDVADLPCADGWKPHGATADHPAGEGRRRTALWLTSAALAVLVCGGVAVAAFSPSVNDAPRKAISQIPDLKSLADIEKLLGELNLADSIRVSPTGSGRYVLSGWVRDEAEQTRLATALAAISPTPDLVTKNQVEVERRVADGLNKMDLRFRLKRQGPGPLRLQAVVADAPTRQAILEFLRNRNDEVDAAPGDVLLASQVIEAFAAASARSGLPAIKADWTQGRVDLKPVNLNTPEQEQLVALVKLLNTRYLDAFVIDAPPKAESAAHTLPFRIASIVGGPQPWLVLGDGTRLLVGGTYADYRLKAIEDTRVVFDEPYPIVIPR